MIKLLITDDSALMRRHLSEIFRAEGDFEIHTARNGQEAIEENRTFEPDVITLDINMPEMDGLTALSILMTERPVPVVMLSSLTEQGAMATFEALNLGAVDFVPKPDGTISLSVDTIREETVHKVRSASQVRLKGAPGASVRTRRSSRKTVADHNEPRIVRRGQTSEPGLVLIGVSTGGPRTLEEILPALPMDFPWPVIIAQHMPPNFTRPFAERMNGLCALNVTEVQRPTPVTPGNVYIGKGGSDILITRRAGRLMVLSRPESHEYLWHPSIELLGRSAQEHCDPQNVIAVMLTGMGHDGAQSFTDLKRRGARTIAESEQSAVVFGMPAELIDRGGATRVLSADLIAGQIIEWVPS